MSMPFCSKCGASVDPSTAYCPSCGTPVGASSTVPPPSWNAQNQASVLSFSDADKVALGKIKTFALLGIIGILLGVIIPAVTGVGFASFLGMGTVSGTVASLAGAVLGGIIVSLVGFIIGIVSILKIRSAFKTLVPVSQGFSSPSKMVLGIFVGLALFVVGFLVLIGGLLSAGASSIGSTGTFSSGALATLAAAGGIIIVAAILALIGIIGIILGLWRAGDRYEEGLLKIGGILFIIPYLDFVAPFLVYFGASSALKKISSSPQ